MELCLVQQSSIDTSNKRNVQTERGTQLATQSAGRAVHKHPKASNHYQK